MYTKNETDDKAVDRLTLRTPSRLPKWWGDAFETSESHGETTCKPRDGFTLELEAEGEGLELYKMSAGPHARYVLVRDGIRAAHPAGIYTASDFNEAHAILQRLLSEAEARECVRA